MVPSVRRTPIVRPLALIASLALASPAVAAGPTLTLYTSDLGLVKESRPVEFRGTRGTLYLWENDQGFEIVPENVRLEELPALNPLARAETRRQGKAVKPGRAALAKRGPFGDPPHARTFLDAVKSRVPGPCPIEVGHRSTTATLLGKLALERGRLLRWDAEAERVTNDEGANARLRYEYRKPWKLA